MKKKITALCVCIAMLAIALIGGTMAYFTDKDEKTNVFTVGNIDIALQEMKGDGTEFENLDGIMPGMTYDKIVNVKNMGNNDAYVQVTITIPENMTPVWNDAVGNEWVTSASNAQLNTSGTFVFRRSSKLGTGDGNNVTSAILKAVTLNADVTEKTVADKYEVTVKADAIQADSFTTPAAAYAALEDVIASAGTVEVKKVSNVDEMNVALQKEDNVVLMTGDIKSGKDIVMGKGTTLDGDGHTLEKTSDVETTHNAGITTVGGKITDINVVGKKIADKGFRAVYATNGLSGDLVIDGATLTGTYALNISGASKDYSLTVKNSTLNGWTSYAPLASAKFEKVTFGTDAASGYHNLKPQADTVLNNCTFDTKFVMDAGAKVTITLNNCKVNGTEVTAANFKDLFAIEPEITSFGCTVVVDGTTVAAFN